MLNIIRRLFFHFGENIANNFGGIVRRPLRARSVDGNVGELGPGESMVEVVFHKIILWKVSYVCGLDVGKVGDGEDSDVHSGGGEVIFVFFFAEKKS